MRLDRKEFLRTALSMVGLGFVASRVAGCDSATTPSGTGAAGTGSSGNACEQSAPGASIATNHGHVLMVSQADVAAGALKTYSIMGTSAHDHMVTVSAANFGKLKAGDTVTITSTTGANHEHVVTIMCA